MKKIYVADDDPTISQVLKLSLAKIPDLEASFFTDGLNLYRAVQQSKPDAIVSDIILPRLDGLAAVRLLKFDEQYREIPVLMISSITDQDIEDQVRKVGADDFLRKPFKPNEIRDRVKALLGLPS